MAAFLPQDSTEAKGADGVVWDYQKVLGNQSPLDLVNSVGAIALTLIWCGSTIVMAK